MMQQTFKYETSVMVNDELKNIVVYLTIKMYNEFNRFNAEPSLSIKKMRMAAGYGKMTSDIKRQVYLDFDSDNIFRDEIYTSFGCRYEDGSYRYA